MISDDIREMARSEVGTEVLAYDLGGKRWVVVEWSPGVVRRNGQWVGLWRTSSFGPGPAGWDQFEDSDLTHFTKLPDLP
jgi:hypothetical protein